jgi:hypothetical protein
MLVGYDWWGYLQDDVPLGNLSARYVITQISL